MKDKFFNNILLSLWFVSVSAVQVIGQQTLKVDLSGTIRLVTHCASGSLYGVTETLPADIANLVAPLKPCVFTQPALSGPGYQQPIGAAMPVSARLNSTTGKVMIRLADVYPGWPYRWAGQADWVSKVTSVINSKKASGRKNYYGYEIWNEPNGTWQAANGDFNTVCWKTAYDLIRSLDPGAHIIGPSYSYYNSTYMRNFLTFCKNNNCLPDEVSWHQWGSASITSTINNYRALEASLGISPRGISINEYSSTTHTYEGCPGVSVPFIAKFERNKVTSACISWWFTNLPGRLGSLLTSKNEKGGGWWLYKWYGDMTGDMVSVTPPNDNSEGLDGFACLDMNARYASICLGGDYTGTANVVVSGIPSAFGNSIKVKLEYVTWSDKDTPVPGTTTISTKDYAVSNGSVTVPVNVTNPFYAYRVYITPVQTGIPVVSISAPANNATFTTPATIDMAATASDPDGSISKVEFYNGTAKLGEDASSPYSYSWTNVAKGSYTLTAVVTDNAGNKATSAPITIKVNVPQGSYNGNIHQIPGTIQVEEYDLGGNGFAYYDDSPGSETGVAFRSDEDVDIEACTDAGGGYNLGWATLGEWLEYTVDVKAAGTYDLDLRVACNGDGRTISVTMEGEAIASDIAIPNTTDWQTWTTTTVKNVSLKAGKQIMRITLGGADYINLNYVAFKAVNVSIPPTVSLTAPANSSSFTMLETVTLTATASDEDGTVASVKFYDDTTLLGTDNTAPFSFDWSGMQPGSHILTAVATDDKGITTTSAPISITITAVQAPYKLTKHTIPGRIEVEEYDLGGEGLGYHEADTNGNQGGATLRNDEVDIEATADVDGDYNISYIMQGEWLGYTVDVLTTDVYGLNLRVAADGDGKAFHIEMDGTDISGSIAVPNTGGWQTWQTVSLNNISLTEGEHVMRIAFDSDYMNLNYVEFTGLVTGIDNNETSEVRIFPNPFTDTGLRIRQSGNFHYRITDLSGSLVEEGEGTNAQLVGKNLNPGMYFLALESNETIIIHKIVKR